MLQVCEICPRCLTSACASALLMQHKAPISRVTFVLGGKWGITWHKTRTPVSHSIRTPHGRHISPRMCFHLADYWLIVKSVFLGANVDISHLVTMKGQVSG